MKAEEKLQKRVLNRRLPQCKENHATLNPTQSNGPSQTSRMRSKPSRRNLFSKKSNPRTLNTKLSKSLFESIGHLNYSVTTNHKPLDQSTPARASKLNALNSLKIIHQLVDDNLENRPINPVPESNKSNRKPVRRRHTLYEKSLNCFDETSNCSNSSDGLNTYSLNPSPTELEYRLLNEIEVPVEEVDVPGEASETTNEVKKEALNVIVPTFRVKKIKMGFRMEGTENMNDDVYEKKHLKLENEEIRIQRWDMKRQRDEFEKSSRLSKSFALNQSLTSKSTQSTPLKRPNTTTTTTSPISLPDQDTDIEDIEDIDSYVIQIVDTQEPEYPANSTEQLVTDNRKAPSVLKPISTNVRQPAKNTKKRLLSIKGCIKKTKRVVSPRRYQTSPPKRIRSDIDLNLNGPKSIIPPFETCNKRRRPNT